MEGFNKDESFLARWIAGELTSEELENFRNSEDFVLYNKINEASQTLKTPKFNKEETFGKIKKQTSKNDAAKVKQLFPLWGYAAAAAIIIAFGIFYFTSATNTYETGFSEQLSVVLPDQSKVRLNANSHLEFKTYNWLDNRTLNLNGEAFFEVEKGNAFKVLTAQGCVEVLGTKFNVVARENYFEVQCREGKVQVTSVPSNEKAILIPGKAVRVFKNKLETWEFNTSESTWTEGESTFFDTPIQQVLVALENQYQITVDASQIDLNTRFTGGFAHKDLNLALRTVCIPMDFTYNFNAEKRVLVLNSSH